MANGNPFYVQPGNNFGQGLQSLAGGFQQLGQQMRQDEQRERLRQGQQEMAQAVQADDAQRLAELSAQYPELREGARQAFQITNEQTEQVARDTYMRALSDPQNATQYMQQGIQRVSELGGTPRMMQSDLELLQQDPEGAQRRMMMGLASVDPEAYEAVAGGQSGPDIGTYNPRDYTTDSFSEFQQTGDPSVLERYESRKIIDVGGVPHLLNPASGTITPGQITDAGFQATGEPRPYQPDGSRQVQQEPRKEPITTETVAESEAEITRQTETAKQEAKAGGPEAQRQRQKAVSQARKDVAGFRDITSQASAIADNPDYVDSLTGITGTIPAIPGTTKYDAKVAFDRLKDTLTLGNLEKMSGILSDSDIKILRSAASGLEPGMSEDAFTNRINKIRSVFQKKTEQEQEKLEQMMEGEAAPDAEQQEQQGSDVDALIQKYGG